MADNRNKLPNFLMAGMLAGSAIIAFATVFLWLFYGTFREFFGSYQAIHFYLLGGVWGFVTLLLSLIVTLKGSDIIWSIKFHGVTVAVFCISILIFLVLV